MATAEGFLTEEQRETLIRATQNAEVLSASPKSLSTLTSEYHIKALADGKASTAGIAVRHVRRSHSGKFVRVKKELGAAAFIFFDKSWKDEIPTDKTGDFDTIYEFLEDNWKFVKWVALGAIILQEADMVLGGDEGKECTYMNGYMKRQAIFSCLTCTPDGNAGVCTACCFSCHDGHEIVELWTKRNFRCDCGNSKFGVVFCKLFPNKDVENAENLYNHNFKGKYCICGGLYPDPDLEEQVEMIQCCICEDWFHEEHLGLESSDEVPRDEEGEPLYEDFICQVCSGVCSFLSLYPQTIWAATKQSTANTTEERYVVENASLACGSNVELEIGSCSVDSTKAGGETSANSGVVVESLEGFSETHVRIEHCTEGAGASVPCVVGVDLAASPPSSEKNKPLFLSKNWRDLLCRCGKCTAFYSQKGVGFLLDHEDSIVEYEKVAKQKRAEKLQQQESIDSSFLDKFGHVKKIEILSGIADMKNELRGFLESCDTSKAITSDDVRQVFENLKKKRRME